MGVSFWISRNTFSLWGWLSAGTDCPGKWRGGGVSLLGYIQDPGPGQPDLGGPDWAAALGNVTFRYAFQSQPFSQFVTEKSLPRSTSTFNWSLHQPALCFIRSWAVPQLPFSHQKQKSHKIGIAEDTLSVSKPHYHPSSASSKWCFPEEGHKQKDPISTFHLHDHKLVFM